MNRELVSTLDEFIAKRNYKEIISLSDAYLSSHPEDVQVRYCDAIARVLSGDVLKGLTRLMEIIRLFGRSATSLNRDLTGSETVGEIALQMAAMAELHRVPNFEAFSVAGARTAELVGKLVNKNAYIQKAQNVLERLWTRGDIQNAKPYLRPTSPMVLQIEPTNHCNQKCTMCARNHMTRPKGFMDLSLFSDIISNWKNRHMQFVFSHAVHGREIVINRPGPIKLFFMGEPLMHKQIGAFIEKGREVGCHIAVQTNGILLSRENIRNTILKSRPSEIAVSLDGIDAHSYEQTRRGGKWDQIVRGINALWEEREKLGLSNQMKIRVSTIIATNTEEARNQARYFLAPIKSCVDEILFILLNSVYSGSFFSNDGIVEPYSKCQTAYKPLLPLCEEPLTKLNILWDGTVTPCCIDVNAHLQLGNAKMETIDSIWNGSSTVALQKNLYYHHKDAVPYCRRCFGV